MVRVARHIGVARCRALPQSAADEAVGEGEDDEGQDVGEHEDEERVGGAPRLPRFGPYLHAVGRPHARRHLDPGHRPADDELHGRQPEGDDPDDDDRRLGAALGDARAQRVHDDPEAVDADGHVRAHARRHRHRLHVQHDGAHGRREYPVVEHRHREGERHAEERHDEVGAREVDEEPA